MTTTTKKKKKKQGQAGGGGHFPGGPVVKNPSTKAGDTGVIPGPGTSHMPRGNKACAPRLLSPCAATTEVSTCPRAPALQGDSSLTRHS